MSDDEIRFSIGTIPIGPGLVVAPMDGITDSAFRCMLRRQGAALCYTEFINARDVLNDSVFFTRKTAQVREEEHPIGFQIYDNDPLNILQAAKKLIPFQPDFFDINIGCSVARVANRGAGAGLLLDPDKIAEIFDRMTNAFSIPITAKIRLGWDDRSQNYLQIAHLIEEHGGAMLAVHARTKAQGFEGKANWPAIREIKESLCIPVIGNGNVTHVAEIHKMKDLTHCDAVMVGRAAMPNPWLFTLRDREEISNAEVFNFIQDHFDLMLEDYPQDAAMILFRKYLNQYLKPLALNREQKIQLFSHTQPLPLLEAIQTLLQLR
ncbi:MAG: tRNA dihydrouridine synthase [Anaerolineaceae bacterium]